jgi:flagellar biosynthesis protein FlhF
MKLKTFIGPSMTEVMRQIKQELGNDAVIVSNRTQDDGSIRVSAAVEEDIIDSDIASDLNIEGVEDTSSLFGGIKDYDALPDETLDHKINLIAKALQRHSLPAFLYEKLISQIEQYPQGSAQECLAGAFEAVFSFVPLPQAQSKNIYMLVGQPGAGKTTTIAKLATHAMMNDVKAAVITADTVRAGAVEQLAAFMRVLKLDLLKVNNPEQLKKAIQDSKSAQHIYIDCPGLNAFDAEAMKELHSYIRTADMQLIVTLPGGVDVEEAAEIARAFAVLGAKYILPTRLDMSRRLGGLLAAADQAKLSFIGMGCRPDIANGLQPLDAMTLAGLLLPKNAEVKS